MRRVSPCTAALRATLNDLKSRVHTLPERHPRRQFILTNAAGKPWTRAAFASAWEGAFEDAFPAFVAVNGRRVRANPPPPDLHFHDLRGTAVTMLAEAVATVPEIATITGHTLASVTKILERYLSRTKTLAQAAIAKLETRMRAA